jgi:hypothetical protein
MVLVSLIGILGLSGGLALVLLAAGAIAPGVILLVFTVIMAIMFWFLRGDLKMCARLLSVAGGQPRSKEVAQCTFTLQPHFSIVCTKPSSFTCLTYTGRGLQECAGLIPVAVGLKFVGLAIMGYIFAALVAAGNIGSASRSGYAAVIVPNNSTGDGALVGSCYDFYGRSVQCW